MTDIKLSDILLKGVRATTLRVQYGTDMNVEITGLPNKPGSYKAMLSLQDMVKDFMVACDQVVGERPGLRDQLLRIRLILEEPIETTKAVYGGDMLETIDGLADSLYVILGTAVAFGIDIYPFFLEVHRSNMAKVDPVTGKVVKDLFGKVVKPAGWTPPDIAGVFQAMYGDVANYPAELQSHDNRWQNVFRMAENNDISPEQLLEYILAASAKKEGQQTSE